MQKKLKDAMQKAYEDLLKQGCCSFKETRYGGRTCLYRGKEGVKCAIGHMISDEYYHVHLEEDGVSNSRVLEAVTKSLGLKKISFSEQRLLSLFQGCHDEIAWKQEKEKDKRSFKTLLNEQIKIKNLTSYITIQE